jgi:hypothetical protein
VGFVVDKVALGQVFFRVFRFPLTMLIPAVPPKSSSSRGDGKQAQIWLLYEVDPISSHSKDKKN